MIDLWRTRLRQHVQAQQKYLRLVFNDHCVLILLILFGGALYVYSQIVKTLQPSWWLALCLAIAFEALTRRFLRWRARDDRREPSHLNKRAVQKPLASIPPHDAA